MAAIWALRVIETVETDLCSSAERGLDGPWSYRNSHNVTITYAVGDCGEKRLIRLTDLERRGFCAPSRAGQLRYNMYSWLRFNPAFAGVLRHPRLVGGGGVKRPHVITRERMAAERRTMRRLKALDETILKHPLNFPNEVTCQVKVRSKVKIGAFRLRAVETSKSSVLGQNLSRVLLKYRARH